MSTTSGATRLNVQLTIETFVHTEFCDEILAMHFTAGHLTLHVMKNAKFLYHVHTHLLNNKFQSQ